MSESELATKIFIVSMLLQELLDETEGRSLYKQKVKFHINGLQKELDKLLSVDVRQGGVDEVLKDSSILLQKALDEIEFK